MALSWIRVDREMRNDEKVRTLALRLADTVSHTVGYCVLVFSEMAGGAKDGNLSLVTDAELELWAGWEGKRRRFAPAFREIFAPTGTVTSWAKHNGDNIRISELDAERKRIERLQRKEAQLRQPNGGRRGEETAGAESPPWPSTGRDGRNVVTTPTPPPAVDLSQWPDFDALFSPRQRWVVADALALLSTVARIKLVAAIGMWRGGGTAPFVPTSAELAQAFSEYDGDGNPEHFWKFVSIVHNRMAKQPVKKRGGFSKIAAGLDHLKDFAAEPEEVIHGE